jgi:hypothetical protein
MFVIIPTSKTLCPLLPRRSRSFRRAPAAARPLMEGLETRLFLAAQVFFQDFDDPADSWLTGPNHFSMTAAGSGHLAQRRVVGAADGAVVQDGNVLRGNWARNYTDPVTGLTTADNNDVRYANLWIDAGSRQVGDEIFLQEWVRFDPGVQAVSGQTTKFLWFRGTAAQPFDQYLDLGGNFNTWRLVNNSANGVGEPWPGHAVDQARGHEVNFSNAPGAAALIGNQSVADWFRGRWHSVQVYMKLNTANGRADGVFRFWLDGVKVLDFSDADIRDSTGDHFASVNPLGMHGGTQAPVTSFGWELDEVELWNGLPTGAPRVSGVYVRGSAWDARFLDHLSNQALGDRDFGFRVPDGPGQVDEMPWVNLNQVAVRFDGITQVGRADLQALGVSVASRDITDFRYDGRTRTAQWTLRDPVPAERLTLALAAPRVNRAGTVLDGEWVDAADAYPSGNGSAGGDFRFRVNVLPGDVNRSGAVAADDASEVEARFFTSTTNPGSGAGAYTIFHDVNGSGSILADDYSEVKKRFFTTLPN